MSQRNASVQPPETPDVSQTASGLPSSGVKGTSLTMLQWCLCVGWLAILAFAAYSSSFEGIAIFDDDPHIKDNLELTQSSPPSLLRPAISRPFVRWTLWWNYQISGYQLWSYHLVNLLAHLVAAITLFEIARRLFRQAVASWTDAQRVWSWLLPLGIASVWIAHPLNTQAVTYIIQRCESMMGMFFLLTLLCLILAVEHRSKHFLWLTVGLMCAYLGMGCKQVMVMVPAVAWLLDWTFLSDSVSKIFRQRLWFYAGLTLIGFYGFYDALEPLINPPEPTPAVAVLNSPEGDSEPKDPTISAGFHFKGFTKWEYFRTQWEVIPFYVRLALWPDPLCLDYRQLVANNPARYWTCGAILAGVFTTGVWLSVQRSPVGFLILSFFLILAPTSSIMPINDMALEHRMYLPLSCVVALLCVGLQRLLIRLWVTHATRVFTTLVLVWTLLLGYMTYLRNFDYHNEIALWTSVVEAAPQNDRAWRNLGHYYNVAKQPEKCLAAFQSALDLMNRIVPTPPKSEFAEVHRNIGNAYKDMGRFNEAISSLQTSIQLNPKDAITQQSLGRVYAINGQLEVAHDYFTRALSFDPNDAEIHHDLGGLNMFRQNFEVALDHFRKARDLAPLRFDFAQTLAGAYADLGRFEDAVHAYDDLLSRLPRNAPEGPQIQAYRQRAFQALQQQRASAQQPR